MSISLDAIRECLDGAVPAKIATCAPDGTPNVSLLSQVHYVDQRHVALSWQFFNKTRTNVLAHPVARVEVVHPHTAECYQLLLRYLRTETQGPLFESMRAKLAGIASHTGMGGVFKLLGADVYEVCSIVARHHRTVTPRPRRNLLTALRAGAQCISGCTEIDGLFDATLAWLCTQFEVDNAMMLMFDPAGGRLYTVASRGYESSGVGSEIPLGRGLIGVCARERTPIRITHMTTEYSYGLAIREQARLGGYAGLLETEIPFPGLAEPASQLAVPVLNGGRLLGVVFTESMRDSHFGYDEEDALVALATQVGTQLHFLQEAESRDEAPVAPVPPRAADGLPLVVRHYAADHSVFLEEAYLIKGVAGAIIWKLLQDFRQTGRSEFTNRELRLDPAIGLPDVSDNLETRLILLQRRLAERCAHLRIDKTGRGRFRLCVTRPLELQER